MPLNCYTATLTASEVSPCFIGSILGMTESNCLLEPRLAFKSPTLVFPSSQQSTFRF
nr:MAG TPA: hypothetical protein [Caudoviricetes sp.]